MMNRPQHPGSRALAISLSAIALMLLSFGCEATPEESEEDGPQVFEAGGLHFTPGPGVVLEHSQHRAPEGEVDIITFSPIDAATGNRAGESFLSVSVFHHALQIDDPQGRTNTQLALDQVVAGVQAAFPDAARIDPTPGILQVMGQSAVGYTFSIRAGATRARVRAFALEESGKTLVGYRQTYPGEEELAARLDAVIDTIGVGPAPR